MSGVRVLHVITGLNLGGAETWLARLAPRLAAAGFAQRVVSLLSGGELAGVLRAAGVPVEDLGMRRGWPGPGAVLRLARIIREFRPQVLQTWLYHADLLGLVAARLSGVRPAVSWGVRCAYMDFSRYGAGTRLTVQACAALSDWPDAVTYNSRAGMEQHRRLGYRPRTAVVLENGVDGARFAPDAGARACVRAEWGLGPEDLAVGLVARVDPMKGHAAFCRAASLVLAQRPELRARLRLVFCGEGAEPGAAELAALLEAHGLAAHALCLGRRGDMPAVYAGLDVLALPSLGEGFPNALAEGLACGLPCACLDAGDARRMVGRGGEVAPAELSGPEVPEAVRAQALASALGRVLALDAASRAEMGARGRAHVLRHFGLERAVSRWAAHLGSLAGPNKLDRSVR